MTSRELPRNPSLILSEGNCMLDNLAGATHSFGPFFEESIVHFINLDEIFGW